MPLPPHETMKATSNEAPLRAAHLYNPPILITSVLKKIESFAQGWVGNQLFVPEYLLLLSHSTKSC